MNKLLPAATLSLLLTTSIFAIADPQRVSAAPPAAVAGASVKANPGVPSPNTLLDGTPVKLRLSQTLSSADAKTGQQVTFEVVEDVKLQDLVVIAKGATALATVTEADHKKTMGRGGKLNLNVDSVRLVDNEKATLRAVAGGKGGGHTGAMTGAMVATGILFFPAAPLFLFIHGKDITLAKGLESTAFVDGDMALNLAAFAPGGSGGPQLAAAAQSEIAVDASVANCDIDVDGAFAGSTPSRLSVSAGKHQITVHKSGYAAWNRSVNASGSGMRLYADLVKEGSQQLGARQ